MAVPLVSCTTSDISVPLSLTCICKMGIRGRPAAGDQQEGRRQIICWQSWQSVSPQLKILSTAAAVILSAPAQTCISTSPAKLCPPNTTVLLLRSLPRLGYFSLHLSHFPARPGHPSGLTPMVFSSEKPPGATTDPSRIHLSLPSAPSHSVKV